VEAKKVRARKMIRELRGVNRADFATISLPRMVWKPCEPPIRRPYRRPSSACFASPPSNTTFLMDERKTATKPYNCLDLASAGPDCPAPRFDLVYFLYLMDFEFDPAKSAANLKKHGVDFLGAQALWSDPPA
jgi:hypothetical protein